MKTVKYPNYTTKENKLFVVHKNIQNRLTTHICIYIYIYIAKHKQKNYNSNLSKNLNSKMKNMLRGK